MAAAAVVPIDLIGLKISLLAAQTDSNLPDKVGLVIGAAWSQQWHLNEASLRDPTTHSQVGTS